MRKVLFFFTTLILAFVLTGCEPQTEPGIDVLTKIPDPVFRAYCQNAMDNEQEFYSYTHSAWDIDGDGKLSPNEATAVIAIDMRGDAKEEIDKVVSLSGIEYFTGLDMLLCSANRLTSLDVSKNSELTHLECQGNFLTTLDISENPNLEYLLCYANKLVSLNASQNTTLGTLSCMFNKLSLLDVSNSTLLTDLYCQGNKLTSLDISNNTALIYLSCYDNPGDRISKFSIKAWFDNDSLPGRIEMKDWEYEGVIITTDFQKIN